MSEFTECRPDFAIVQRTVAQIPWRSNVASARMRRETETGGYLKELEYE
jgi:hypothetical protein